VQSGHVVGGGGGVFLPANGVVVAFGVCVGLKVPVGVGVGVRVHVGVAEGVGGEPPTKLLLVSLLSTIRSVASTVAVLSET
jgi:hypothetical protein